MQYRGVIIPGLAMEKQELPEIEGFLRLQNPEVNDGPVVDGPYGIEDIAKLHVETIAKLNKADAFHVMGMSMGGMITSVMASKFRSHLPSVCKFHFIVTGLNSPERPIVTPELLTAWQTVKPEDEQAVEQLLTPFFSSHFLKSNYKTVKDYIQYRVKGGNRQTPEAFMRQVMAIVGFKGPHYYNHVNQEECYFLHGSEDNIFNDLYQAELKKICPKAVHQTENVGHMVNIENPALFKVG